MLPKSVSSLWASISHTSRVTDPGMICITYKTSMTSLRVAAQLDWLGVSPDHAPYDRGRRVRIGQQSPSVSPVRIRVLAVSP